MQILRHHKPSLPNQRYMPIHKFFIFISIKKYFKKQNYNYYLNLSPVNRNHSRKKRLLGKLSRHMHHCIVYKCFEVSIHFLHRTVKKLPLTDPFSILIYSKCLNQSVKKIQEISILKLNTGFKSKGTLMTFKKSHFNYRDKKKSFQKNFQIKGTEFLPQT